MNAINERKRARITGKGSAPRYFGIEHWIIDKPEFKALKGSPIKMLIAIGRQYNGFNNGNLMLSTARDHWRSDDTAQVNITRLIEDGWVVKTRRGGLGIGSDLYAITWWSIDVCKIAHDYPAETTASHSWMKNRTPLRKPELVVPKTGTGDAKTCSESNQQVPKTGTENDVFKAA